MNICTIATEGDWAALHLPRWVRYVRKHVPDADLYLFFMGTDTKSYPALLEFKNIVFEDARNYGRKWFNGIRMGAVTAFKLSEILYLDCDADVLKDISDIPKLSAAPLLCCRSPVMHGIWPKVRLELLGGLPECELNNGLIYLRRDFTKEYLAAWDKTEGMADVPDRIRGTIAFNLMLEDLKRERDWDTIASEYGTIWWEAERMIDAKIIQYCNSEGQAKRLRLEDTWRAAQ